MGIDELISLVERAFAFLLERDWILRRVERVAPASFKGGFVLSYANRAEGELSVQFLDMEVEVDRNGIELFGPVNHTGFAGNQFSREKPIAVHRPDRCNCAPAT